MGVLAEDVFGQRFLLERVRLGASSVKLNLREMSTDQRVTDAKDRAVLH